MTMAKFVLAYRGGSVPETQADQDKVMAAWMSWFGDLGTAVLDGGNPFGPSTTIGAPGADSLTGYTVLDAADLDDAARMAKGCPVLDAGGSVDVYSTIDM
jgi:YCII-related domain